MSLNRNKVETGQKSGELYHNNIELLPISHIKKSSCNERLETDNEHIKTMILTLQRSLKEGKVPPFPAIYVRIENHEGDEVYGCYDGIHRLEAYRQCGFDYIPAIIDNVSDEEALLRSHQLNCGKIASEGETAKTCSKLYTLGQDCSDIGSRFGWTDDTTRKYVKIGGYLNDQLLSRIKKYRNKNDSNTLTVGAAILLCEADQKQQLEIANKISDKNQEKQIKSFFNNGEYSQYSRTLDALRSHHKNGTPLNSKPKKSKSKLLDKPNKQEIQSLSLMEILKTAPCKNPTSELNSDVIPQSNLLEKVEFSEDDIESKHAFNVYYALHKGVSEDEFLNIISGVIDVYSQITKCDKSSIVKNLIKKTIADKVPPPIA